MSSTVARAESIEAQHGALFRRVVGPVVGVATICSLVGKGLGLRTGGIVVLALTAAWTLALYVLAERRYRRAGANVAALTLATVDAEPASDRRLHEHTCISKAYWEYLRFVMAEVANTSVLRAPESRAADPSALGPRFAAVEGLTREWLDHLLPPGSRYVAYYVMNGVVVASPNLHNGWRARPPAIAPGSSRDAVVRRAVTTGRWVVLSDTSCLEGQDLDYRDLCIDSDGYGSLALVPLRVDEAKGVSQRNVLPVGALVIDCPETRGVSPRFCETALQVAADLLALGFANAELALAAEVN